MSFRPLAVALLLAAAPLRAGVDVQIRGLGSDEESNAYARISLLDYAKATDAAHGEYDEANVRRLFEQGAQEIKTALQPFGWYQVQVQSELRGTKPDWTAVYRVDAGPETDIEKVEVLFAGAGKDEAALKGTKLRLRIGARLKHQNYEDSKEGLLRAAYGLGYLDASFSRHELRIDTAANKAQALLTLDTGPRWYFGGITIEQDGKLSDAFLRRYLRMEPGAPYDPQKVLDTQFAFTDLGYFSTVEVESQKEKADAARNIPIVVRTERAAPRAYRYGLGYGTDTGPRALIGATFRRLNQQGHKLDLEFRPSQNISTAIAAYKIPLGTYPGEDLDFTAQGLLQRYQDIDERLYSFGTGYTQLKGRWQRHWYLTYANDDYTLPDEPRRTSTLLTPGVSFSRTSADDPIFPRRGWFIFFDVHGASHYDQLSDSDFIEAHLKLRAAYTLMRRTRLLLRAEEGAALVSGFDNLPPSQRFFAGGDDSVRGYAYRSLGPKNEFGRVVGGRYLTTLSAETDYDITRTYGAAAFIDAGGADDVPNVRLHTGVGLGFRYRAPFGAIAVDIAHPLDQGEDPVRLHIGVRVGL